MRMTGTEQLTSSQLRVEPVTSIADFEEPWRRLLATDKHATYFSYPEWLRTWWQHFGTEDQLQLLAVYHDDDLIGLAPLMLTRQHGIPVIQFIGTGLSDYADFVIDDSLTRRAAVVFAVLEHLHAAHRHAVIDLHQVPGDSPTLPAIHAWLRIRGRKSYTYRQAVCPYFELPTDIDTFNGLIGRNKRQQERRRLRRLAEIAEVTFDDNYRPPGKDWTALRSELAAVEEGRAAERGYTRQWVGARGRFFENVLAETAHTNRLRLVGLRVGGQLIAYDLAFICGSTVYGYADGFDIRYRAQSPGSVMRLHILRLSIESGRRVFDLLRGEEPHKSEFTTKTRQNYRVQFPLSDSPISAAAVALRKISGSAREKGRNTPWVVSARDRLLQWRAK